ncbi:hypothetical protein AEAC466_00120 [Asticcacaulis sp. AC466]|uniref:response regulator n=1 Tax=Asticcacaulis sp. AC466 TaxID=1282362 RepID=UPI0003C3E856|nr:response regulator [Asticcacaulis sp. AC466]ESQ85611.1 hypothetical protein AEAC466_00120 [Asticcacaulis sp. AC466]
MTKELPAAEKSENAMRIMVVDDNEASADTLHWAVELMGYDVRSCHDGQSALRLATDFRPDVVLLDIGMPHMDGLEVGRALRTMPGLSGIKIIAQTGWGDSQTRRQTAEAGFDLHLVKPVNMDTLEDMLWLLRSNAGRLAA